jgi:hypothetical protein
MSAAMDLRRKVVPEQESGLPAPAPPPPPAPPPLLSSPSSRKAGFSFYSIDMLLGTTTDKTATDNGIGAHGVKNGGGNGFRNLSSSIGLQHLESRKNIRSGKWITLFGGSETAAVERLGSKS